MFCISIKNRCPAFWQNNGANIQKIIQYTIILFKDVIFVANFTSMSDNEKQSKKRTGDNLKQSQIINSVNSDQ